MFFFVFFCVFLCLAFREMKKTRMCFFTGEKNADVFFESKPKTRMCLEFKIKNAYVFLDGRKKRGCVLEVGLKKRVCVFFQIKKQNRVCFSHTVICDSCLVTSVGCGVSGSQYSCCALRCLFGLLHLFRQVRLWKIAK